MELTEQLRRLLGSADLAWLVARVRRRMELGSPLSDRVTLAQATPAQRAALARLLGRPPSRGGSLSVSLAEVDTVLRRSGASPDGLAAAIVALTGPVVRRSEAAAAAEGAWQRAFAPLDEVVTTRPELAAWWAGVRDGGLVARLAGSADRAEPMLVQLAGVLAGLPARGEPLGIFAARVVGQAHALDDDRPLATLALSAARAVTGLPPGDGAEFRRELWAAVGLLRDELSSTVLTLGLPGDQRSATGRALAAMQVAGQPMVLTLRQLVRDPPALDAAVVSVCENPAVVATAGDRLGASCPPLVCTAGQPSAAAITLLRSLTTSGAALRYHGDFDWGGVRIANALHRRLPFSPWRFDTASYLEAAPCGGPLRGVPVEATWDPRLGAAMRAQGRAVEEESVVDRLVGDLAAS